MNNLYHIIDRDGNDIKFKMNPIQEDVFDNIHTRNLILKARQVGLSTFSVLYLLDETLFNNNLSAGVVSYSLQHAQHIFKRIIGHALDHMPKELGDIGIVQRSAHEITFSNGSFLRVDTTLRGGTCQLVLVSEFGKTCARSPQKAEEVITGTLQTVAQDGRIIIESTAEGASGYFSEMVTQAADRGNENLSPLDYRLFFYSWDSEINYTIDHEVKYDTDLTDYFVKIEKEKGIELKQGQKNWYAQQKKILGEKILQEFPSTISESFLSSSEAFYYSQHVAKAYEEGRILNTPIYDPLLPVYVSMDIAVNDLTAIIFFQVHHSEIRIIDFYEDNNKGLEFYANFLLNEKKYIYHTIFLPHDAAKRDGIVVENTYAREFGKIFSHTDTKFHVLKRTDVNIGIVNAQNKFCRCLFALNKTKKLLEHLTKYRKQWHEGTGRWLDRPLHDHHCLVSGTYVDTDKGKKTIESIIVGDKVLTPKGYKKVLKTYKYKTKNLVKIKTINSEIICTTNHKVFSSKGLVNADTLRYNDRLLTKNDKEICNKITYHGRETNSGFRDCFSLIGQSQLYTLMDIGTKTTKQFGSEHAKSAGKIFAEDQIQNNQHVLKVVELNLDTEVEVYDIEVEDDHCYFANEILVSNSDSSDSLRYAMAGVNHLETVGSMSGALDKHRKAVDMRNRRI
jgi:hypothetical protein